MTDDEEAARLHRVALHAEGQARIKRWQKQPQEMATRFREVVAGGAPDAEALRWAEFVIHTASSAASKLWTMYVRGETERKSELDELIGLFNSESPDEAIARLRRG